MNRWRRRPIALALANRRTRVEDADTFGDWAYLKTPTDMIEVFIWGWQVVHVPTGRVLLGDLANKAMARQLCSRVARLCDWSQYPDGRPDQATVTRLYETISGAKQRHYERLYARQERRHARGEAS